MKWRGIVNIGDAAPWKPVPMSVDRAAMAVLSQQVSTTLSMPACIRAALIATEGGSSYHGASHNGNGASHNGNGASPNGNGNGKGASAHGNGNGASAHGSGASSNGAPGPLQLTLKGGLVIGGLGVELIFRSRPKPASGIPRDVTTKATLLPAGKAIEIHDKSGRAKVGGDPAAWVQIRDGDGVPLTDQIYIGQLGRGPCLMDPAFPCLVTAETYVSPVGIFEPAESDLTLTGEMIFDRGLSLRVVLRRREGPLWWGRRPDAVLDFDIVTAGHMIHFPAQPIWTGESVGTLRSLIFLDGGGEPIGNEHLLKPTVALQ
jgi:hypothetical protein